jgi:hypothetical protein
MSLSEPLHIWMSFLRVSCLFHRLWCSWNLPFSREVVSISVTRESSAFLGYSVCVPVYLSDQSEVVSVWRGSEFMWSPWGSWQPVCAFACFVQVRNTVGWKTAPGSQSVIFWVKWGNPLPDHGRCNCGKEVASSKVQGAFLADLPSKGLRCLCTHQVRAILSSKVWGPDWE